MVVATLVPGLKTGCISRNRWNNLFFCMVTTKSYDDNYWVGLVENRCGLLNHGKLKFAVFHE